jgi:CheY-like chemotaxis protein
MHLMMLSRCLRRESAIPSCPSILIAESHPLIAELLAWVLEARGYRTQQVADLASLLHLPHTLPAFEPPALLLLDISIPARGVSATVSVVRACWQTCGITLPPLIVLTTNPQISEEAHLAGYPALLKPFHLCDLDAAVQRTLHPGPLHAQACGPPAPGTAPCSPHQQERQEPFEGRALPSPAFCASAPLLSRICHDVVPFPSRSQGYAHSERACEDGRG